MAKEVFPPIMIREWDLNIHLVCQLFKVHLIMILQIKIYLLMAKQIPHLKVLMDLYSMVLKEIRNIKLVILK